jgi:hypothetical protein
MENYSLLMGDISGDEAILKDFRHDYLDVFVFINQHQ